MVDETGKDSAEVQDVTEWRVVYTREGDDDGRSTGFYTSRGPFSTLERAQQEYDYVRRFRDEAWIESRVVTAWRRVDG